MCFSLEETLYYYGVDLMLQSHKHSYERLYPLFKGVVLSNNYTNPRAPVQITIGAASANHVEATILAPPTNASNASNVTSGSSDKNEKTEGK